MTQTALPPLSIPCQELTPCCGLFPLFSPVTHMMRVNGVTFQVRPLQREEEPVLSWWERLNFFSLQVEVSTDTGVSRQWVVVDKMSAVWHQSLLNGCRLNFFANTECWRAALLPKLLSPEGRDQIQAHALRIHSTLSQKVKTTLTLQDIERSLYYVLSNYRTIQSDAEKLKERRFYRIKSPSQCPLPLLIDREKILLVLKTPKRDASSYPAPQGKIKLAIDLLNPDNLYDIKIRHLEYRERDEEYLLHAPLSHPYIVPLTGKAAWVSRRADHTGPVMKRALITPQYARGHLGTFASKPHWKRDVLLRMAHQMLSALEYLHSKKIIHRNIRPEHILIDREFNCAIAGFESSVHEDQKHKIADPMSLLSVFTAPEISFEFTLAGGRLQTTTASDVWSMGVVLLFLFKLDFKTLIGSFKRLAENMQKMHGRLWIARDLTEELWLGKRPTPPEGMSDSIESIVWDMLTISSKARITASDAKDRLFALIPPSKLPPLRVPDRAAGVFPQEGV